MPNIGLTDENYKKLNDLKEIIEQATPAARPTYDGLVGWLVTEQLKRQKKSA